MSVLNIGSMNIDHVYAVPHFVSPGETMDSLDYRIFAGGKGFNQSIALARAGVATRHAGQIGREGEWLLDRLRQEGIDTSGVVVGEEPTGHAIIQVDPSGENAIVLHGGANRRISPQAVCQALIACQPEDVVLLQNETSSVAEAIEEAAGRGLKVAFNPAPMTAEVARYPLEKVSLLILNQTEAKQLTGKTDPDEIHIETRRRFPQTAVVLTLGSKGAVYMDPTRTIHQEAQAVKAIDTTAAGDTFTGYFLAEWLRSGDPAKALATGCRAAAICVTRQGAADSIPFNSLISESG